MGLPFDPLEHPDRACCWLPFPPLRPAPKPAAHAPAKGKGAAQATKRHRSFSLPSIPILPILAGPPGLAA